MLLYVSMITQYINIDEFLFWVNYLADVKIDILLLPLLFRISILAYTFFKYFHIVPRKLGLKVHANFLLAFFSQEI